MVNGNGEKVKFWDKYGSMIKGLSIILALIGGAGSFVYQVGYGQAQGDTSDAKIEALAFDFDIHRKDDTERFSKKADKKDVSDLEVKVDKVDSVVTVLAVKQELGFRAMEKVLNKISDRLDDID